MNHVSCLACREIHIKCSRDSPKCRRCVIKNIDCSYVKSKRGGARTKGVSKKQHLSPSKVGLGTRLSNDATLIKHPRGPSVDLDRGTHSSLLLPTNSISTSETLSTPSSLDLFLPNYNSVESINTATSNNLTASSSVDKNNYNVQKHTTDLVTPKISNVENMSEIIDIYYETFHNAHPFLPICEDFQDYLDNLSRSFDLISAMKLIGIGQKFENNFNNQHEGRNVQQEAENIVAYIESHEIDLVSLQSLLLLSYVTHLCGLHALSGSIRSKAVNVCLEGHLHIIDANELPDGFTDVKQESITNVEQYRSPKRNFLISSRFIDPHQPNLRDCIRRVFWEIYYLDTLLGIVDGKTFSQLSTVPFIVKHPTSPKRENFDYQTRTESSVVLDFVLRLNNSILNKKPHTTLSLKIKAMLGSLDLKIKDPEIFKLPPLVNFDGTVNDGVHQAIQMHTFAKLLLNRPISCLYDPYYQGPAPSCGLNSANNNPQSLNQRLFELYDVANTSKIIGTRACITSANFFVSSLIDTDLNKIGLRSPVVCCSLAFSILTHLSAYLWIETGLKNKDKLVIKVQSNFSQDELVIIKEYLKISLTVLYMFSKHWYMSSQVYGFLTATIKRYAEPLYASIESSLPHEHNSDAAVNNSPKNNELPVEAEVTDDPFKFNWTSFEDIEGLFDLFQNVDNNWSFLNGI